MSDKIVTKENWAKGLRVKRGPKWVYNDQDKMSAGCEVEPNASGIGTILTSDSSFADWVEVKWDSGHKNSYPLDGALCIYVPKTTSAGLIVTEEIAHVGMKVVRGRDWDWSAQDCDVNGSPTVGMIELKKGTGWVKVKWESGRIDGYRVGADGKFDLYVYVPAPESKPGTIKVSWEEAEKALKEKMKKENDVITSKVEALRESMERAKSKTKTQYGTTSTGHGPFKVRRAISAIQGSKGRSRAAIAGGRSSTGSRISDY